VDNVTAEINLIAAIVEQAKRDANRASPPTACDVEFTHNPRRCARFFLGELDTALKDYPGMRIYELAETVMELIG
jgi:hypothetical protein